MFFTFSVSFSSCLTKRSPVLMGFCFSMQWMASHGYVRSGDKISIRIESGRNGCLRAQVRSHHRFSDGYRDRHSRRFDNASEIVTLRPTRTNDTFFHRDLRNPRAVKLAHAKYIDFEKHAVQHFRRVVLSCRFVEQVCSAGSLSRFVEQFR